MSPAEWFRKRWARRLSRTGEHAAALALTDARDVPILSAAGMHLSVLQLSPAGALERAVALAHLGEVDEPLAIARRFSGDRRARVLLGMLATLAPDRVQDLVSGQAGMRNVRAYCLTATGEYRFARDNALSLDPLHALQAELASDGFGAAAREHFRRVYGQAGLAAPQLEGCGTGLDIRTLRAAPAAPRAAGPEPLISVVLTAYNEKDLLPVAVRSILEQDWRNLELLIVDDGSTDGTWDTARALAQQDPRIKLLRSPTNAGTWNAKNLALAVARGEFITMHDADDWSHPAKLRVQVTPLIEQPQLQCTSSYFFRVTESTGMPFTRNAASFLRWNVSSLMFRAGLLRHIGVYRDMLLGGDCEFAARIELFNGPRSHLKIRKPLAIGLQREKSLSNAMRHRDDGSVRLAHWESWRREHMRVYRNPRDAWRGGPARPGTPGMRDDAHGTFRSTHHPEGGTT